MTTATSAACTETARPTSGHPLHIGRFAPSPSGPLHAGSLVAALASYLDARAAGGRWLLRIEDIDGPRTVAGADRVIMDQLDALGLHWDGVATWQSRRTALYQQAFDTLAAEGLVYPCSCTRREIAEAARALPVGADGERPYPGTCRDGATAGRAARSWRLRVPPGIVSFQDRWLGPQSQDVEHGVGDFILRRADGQWAYQLAVVVDDGDQGVTDIVRGADLLSSTARQQVLARMLGLPVPRVMHVPLVIDPATGLKLSKQNHAPALDTTRPVQALAAAWRALGFGAIEASDARSFLDAATQRWARRYRP
jgi:glutamyl-Q tRNA(Asp) synthetase